MNKTMEEMLKELTDVTMEFGSCSKNKDGKEGKEKDGKEGKDKDEDTSNSFSNTEPSTSNTITEIF